MMVPNLPQFKASDIDILNFERVNAFGDSILYRSGATFLGSLRSNLHLSVSDLSAPNSLVSTPTSAVFSSIPIHPQRIPSPLSIATIASTAETSPDPDTYPTFTTAIAPPDAVDDRGAALRLIADSILQQRQLAAKSLVLHPASLAVVLFVIGSLARFCDLCSLFTATTGLTVAALAALYWTTAEYAILAQRINWEWMSGSSPPAIPSGEQVNSPKKHSKCDEPLVLVSKRGKDVIGTLVMKVVKRKRKAYVRAWTINSAQRNKGFGGGLLEDGVRTAWGKGARAFEFEYEYAYSHHVLPSLFNGAFDKREAKARAILADIVEEVRRERSSR